MAGHVTLLAGHKRNGAPVHEQVPADDLGDGRFRVLGTPGMAHGCAAGDVIVVDAQGDFSVQHRGGNVAAHMYRSAGFGVTEVEALNARFDALGGTAEAPPNAKFVVGTVPASAGFASIEGAIADWLAERAVDGANTDIEWFFGNVYDDQDQPLNWWA